MNNKHYRNEFAHRIVVLGTIMTMAMGAVAAQAQDATAPAASDVDHSTKQWLSIQRDNRASAPVQPMLGDVASLVYQRYLDSFKNKIPESMSTQLGSSSGGMSGSGQSTQ
ncbi:MULTISPECIES: DUF3613 domain-containing protein [unclassified Burkholderia]|uniref:DUF3613 domain-containing protein n=1 Tax=unclassified Burkholderia TaxID=2613784 RepID=UPI0005CE4C23|nr:MULTISPECIES: DUF3613 domain-containing protein [unclassified Burkholderia]TGN95058.1 DUF3613 domain-containing protein [Burkholderia sp. USMB20]